MTWVVRVLRSLLMMGGKSSMAVDGEGMIYLLGLGGSSKSPRRSQPSTVRQVRRRKSSNGHEAA